MQLEMSMLAEPRRKQKLSVDPRGSNWSKDDSKFGQKMLEKFGWSKGKGLGAKEDGSVNHVKVSVKNNNHGLGCAKTQVDNWIAHQDDFNALLANLNQSNQLTETDKVTSLENKSKTSRSRVHYKKFTKGKDLSAKSAEDLDCIFGRRGTKVDNTTPSGSADEEEDECKTGGFKTINSDANIQDYFAKKMANLKNTRSSSQPELQSILKYHFTENDNDEVSNDSFGKSSYKRVSFLMGDYDENEDSKNEENKINESGDNSDCKKLKKKKSKKRKQEKIEQTEEENLTENMTSPNNPTIKKKKKEYSQTEEVEENREKGKKKIKKEEEMQNCENVDVIKDNDLIKDKKKSKKRTNTYRRLSADGKNLIHALNDMKKQLISVENDVKKKKHKTKKLLNEEECQKREKKKKVVKMAPKIIIDFEEAFKGSNISTIEGYALETGYDVDFIKKKIKKRQKTLC